MLGLNGALTRRTCVRVQFYESYIHSAQCVTEAFVGVGLPVTFSKYYMHDLVHMIIFEKDRSSVYSAVELAVTIQI